MLGNRRYEKFLERNGSAATIYVLHHARDAHNPRKGIKRELRGAAAGASTALQDYGSFLWTIRKSEPEPVKAFVKALGGAPSNFVSAHRVLTLALLQHRIALTQPSALDDLMENAARVLDADSPWERWVVDFGPIPADDPQEGEENRHAIFIFGVAHRMIEAALGTDVEGDLVTGAQLQFTSFFGLGIEVQQDELMNNWLANVV